MPCEQWDCVFASRVTTKSPKIEETALTGKQRTRVQEVRTRGCVMNYFRHARFAFFVEGFGFLLSVIVIGQVPGGDLVLGAAREIGQR